MFSKLLDSTGFKGIPTISENTKRRKHSQAFYLMKYPEHKLSMETALPSSVQCWLGNELEIRGIDSVIYSRYIIHLLPSTFGERGYNKFQANQNMKIPPLRQLEDIR
jgi:hypothetical protein